MNDENGFGAVGAAAIGLFALGGAVALAPIGALIGWSMGKALVGAGIGALVGAVGGGALAAAGESVVGTPSSRSLAMSEQMRQMQQNPFSMQMHGEW